MERLINKLRQHNIDIEVVGDQIRLNIPEGFDAAGIIQEVRQHKQELLLFISNNRQVTDYRTIEPCPRQADYVLSSGQKRLWFLHQLHKSSLAYNLPRVLRFNGSLDRYRVKEAFDQLIIRHESLRTFFPLVNGEPRQQVAPHLELDLEYHSCPAEKVDDIIRQFIRPFELSRLPLMRAGLIEIEGNNDLLPRPQILLVDMHHIITDGISNQILVRDVISLYHRQPLPPLRLHYKDYAEWQQRVQLQQRAGQQAFWRALFSPLPTPLELPTDFSRPLVKSYAGQQLDFYLAPEATRRLKAVACQEGATLFMVLLSAYAILLSKLSNQQDVVVGTPVAGRQHAELEQVIGMFVNTMPLRVQVSPAASYRQFLAAVKTVTLAASDQQAYPFEELINDLQLRRETGRNPLFEVMLLLHEAQSVSSAAPPAQATAHLASNGGAGGAKFDLTLTATEEGERLAMSFEYATDLFKAETVARFAAYLCRVIEAVSADLDVVISRIELVGEEERNQLLNGFNRTQMHYPKDESIITLFERQVRKEPDSIALRCGNREVSYLELNSQAGRLAAHLKREGIRRQEIVAILLERSVQCIESILAVLMNGAIYLPIDPGNPDERINFILEDSKAKLLLTQESIVATRAIHPPAPPVLLDRSAAQIAACPCLTGECALPGDTLYVIYTSGSTGKPKGVLGSQQGLLNRLYWGWENYPFARNEVCCQKTSLSFVDHVVELFAPLLKGVSLVIPQHSEVSNAEEMLNLLFQRRITRITLVPSLLDALIRAKRNENIRLDALKYVFSSGETLGFNLAENFYKEFSNTRLVNIYGSSEVGADVTCYPLDRYNVEEVLKYFKNSLPVEYPGRGEGDGQHFTARHMGLEKIAEKFLDSQMPAYPVSLEEYYDKLYKDVIPYTINTTSPTFIGHMTSVLPDYVHDLSKLISQLNQNLVKIETSKSVTFLEREAVAILHRVFYVFPDSFYREYIQKLNFNLGIITSGGSTANLSALLSARNKALFRATGSPAAVLTESIYSLLRQQGYQDMVVIGSQLMHYSIRKAISVLGLGTKNIIYVSNDDRGSMCARDLERKIKWCREEHLLVIAVVGIAGSTERGSIDPLREIGEIAAPHNIHFHVDAAWGGALVFSDAHKHLISGIEGADSITFCGHKQLFLPQGISICLFKDPAQLNYNSTTARYQASPNSFDTGRYTIEGSRPALSICLHASLRVIGKKGYELLINSSIEKTVSFARMIGEMYAFELISNQINIINYRYIPTGYREKLAAGQLTAEMNDEVNRVNNAIQEYQFYQGKTFVSKTTISHLTHGEIIVFRCVLSNPLITQDDLINVLKDQLAIVETLFGERNELAGREKKPAVPPAAPDSASTGQREHRKIAIGKPIANTQILILDAHHNLQPVGVTGELCVSGPGLAGGYLGRPELTAKTFVAHPFCENTRMYKTGDLARWLPDGNLELVGRLDNQVKIRGFRIEVGEIEQSLCEHPGIDQAVVVPRERGGDKYLVAYYVPRQEPGAESLRNYLSGKLPDYMIPAQYVSLASLPLNPSGKTDRLALPKPQPGTEADYVPPAGALEKTLVRIWSEVLGLEEEQISVHKSFFELGGHSLIAPILVSDICRQLNVSFHLTVLFQFQTVASLAGYIATNLMNQPLATAGQEQ